MTTTAPTPATRPDRAGKPSPEQLAALGAELDAIRRREVADLGDVDANYIRTLMRRQRKFEIAGRALFYVPILGWPFAVACLTISKILDNMEIGHNVLHGQYDWMGDPAVHSRTFEMDTVVPSAHWQYSHNYKHHTFTNILGKDRDIGFGVLRVHPSQKWHPYYLGNVVWALVLMIWFEWALAFYNLEVENIVTGSPRDPKSTNLWPAMRRKIRQQKVKDYIVFPLLTGPLFPLTFLGNLVANLLRNMWEFANDMCAHLTDDVVVFTEEECYDENGEESRGHWYYRQLVGSSNITGGPLYHVMCGNVSHQIEHHLFPDIPARRYVLIAPEIREICERYGIEYNTGRLSRQLWGFWKKVLRHSLPSKPRTIPTKPRTIPA